MSDTPLAVRRPPGPSDQVHLGIDPETLVTLTQARKEFGHIVAMRRRLGEYFPYLEMKVHLGLLLPRFRMIRVDEKERGLELAVNLRSASDIWLQPVIRKA